MVLVNTRMRRLMPKSGIDDVDLDVPTSNVLTCSISCGWDVENG